MQRIPSPLPKVGNDEKLILRFGTAITGPTTNGVRFSISVGKDELWGLVRDRGRQNTAGSETPGESLFPSSGPISDHSLDLTRWAGQTIDLTLTVNALGDPTHDWANWVDPRIVVDRAVAADKAEPVR